MLEKLASTAGSGAGMPANTAGFNTGIGWLGVTAGTPGVIAGRLGVSTGIGGLVLAMTGVAIIGMLGERAGMPAGVTPETLRAARLAARAAGSGAGMPAITEGSSTVLSAAGTAVSAAGGTGGELAITWVGVSVSTVAGVRVAGAAAGAGDWSVPKMGTSGRRGSLVAAAGTADITVGAADVRGVAAAGAALLATAESPAGVTMGGGYSSSTGIL